MGKKPSSLHLGGGGGFYWEATDKEVAAVVQAKSKGKATMFCILREGDPWKATDKAVVAVVQAKPIGKATMLCIIREGDPWNV
jgi:hypothetical protein